MSKRTSWKEKNKVGGRDCRLESADSQHQPADRNGASSFLQTVVLLTVVVALAGRVGQDHLHAAVGGVVRPLALLAEHVADAVGVRLVELRAGRRGDEILEASDVTTEAFRHFCSSVLHRTFKLSVNRWPNERMPLSITF